MLVKNWKTVARRGWSMWLAYLGIAWGFIMQVPELAIHLQVIADYVGIGVQGSKFIAIASALAAISRIVAQNSLKGKDNG